MATDLTDLAAKIKPALGAGLSINNGQREPIVVSVTRLNAAALITPNADSNQAVVQTTTDIQAAIADLPAFTVTTVAQANTAVQAIRTLLNTLLAELRAAEMITP
jgi:hypothetical protein